jgi:hypothetical protein
VEIWFSFLGKIKRTKNAFLCQTVGGNKKEKGTRKPSELLSEPGPVGYGLTTLPLRHSDFVVDVDITFYIFQRNITSVLGVQMRAI